MADGLTHLHLPLPPLQRVGGALGAGGLLVRTEEQIANALVEGTGPRCEQPDRLVPGLQFFATASVASWVSVTPRLRA